MIHTQRIRLHCIRDLDNLAVYPILLNLPMKHITISPDDSGNNTFRYRQILHLPALAELTHRPGTLAQLTLLLNLRCGVNATPVFRKVC